MKNSFIEKNPDLKQTHRQAQKFLLVLLVMMSFAMTFWLPNSSALADDEPPLFEVGGRVLNEAHNPLAGAQVRLLDRKGNIIESDSSGPNGVFALKHKECEECTLSVVPGEKSPLASALIENIPGNIDRKFLVTLQRGFRVSGRVTGGGKGLKGLVVKVTATGKDQHVHTGGEARTARGGTFEMNLTPGSKHLVVLNEKYSTFTEFYETELSVTADREIGEIQLPAAK